MSFRTQNPLEREDASGRVESVTDFTRRIKALLEGEIVPCWVRGEVSNLRVQASGHVYFSLKDAGAQLSAVLFRGDAARQTTKLRDGMQLLVFGQLSLYEPRGQYQMIVRAVIEDGVGRLQQAFEALKRKLAAEGLFEAGRKKPLPALPETVGFITSPTGAAVQDFIRILTRRGWKGRVVVLPCKVQGEGAAEEMRQMLVYAQSLKRSAEDGAPSLEGEHPFFDLLVIGRGGGSLEDLWAFNEEPLVRAVAACALPIVSAVGHEIDFTLCDFAADLRAETPSAAAELVSSGFVAAVEKAKQLSANLRRFADRSLADAKAAVDPLKGRLRLLAPAAQIERGYLRLDDLGNRLGAALRHACQLKRQGLETAQAEFRRHSPEQRIQNESQRLLALWKRLQSASPQSVLNRGFVILHGEGGPVSRSADLKPGQAVEAQFADGRARLRAEEGEKREAGSEERE